MGQWGKMGRSHKLVHTLRENLNQRIVNNIDLIE